MPIQINEVTHIYQKGTVFEQVALQDVSMSINDGDIIGIMGSSGSGKSTLLQIITGLISPDYGEVVIDGTKLSNISKKNLKQLRKRIGLVFQYPEQQIFELSVFDEVAFAPRNFGLNDTDVKERVKAALTSVGMSFEQFKDRNTNTLSSGEKRRVAIAGILALQPRYLLLDEPTAGLDYHGRNALTRNLYQLNQEQQTSIVIVSHNPSYLFSLCNRFIILFKGKILLQGDITDLLDKYNVLKKEGLSLPATHELLWNLNQRGWKLPLTIRTPEELADEIIKNKQKRNENG